jgi:hypothetical protein
VAKDKGNKGMMRSGSKKEKEKGVVLANVFICLFFST